MLLEILIEDGCQPVGTGRLHVPEKRIPEALVACNEIRAILREIFRYLFQILFRHGMPLCRHDE